MRNIFFKISSLVLIFFLGLSGVATAQTINPNHKVGTVTGKYHFSYSQMPDQLVELSPAFIPNTGLTYQWEQSNLPLSGFVNINGAIQSSYTFGAPLTNTMYYRRKTSNLQRGSETYSNVIKVSVVSATWEDINYIREHTVLVTCVSTWTAVDQLPIGQKLQSTTYMDGIGRSVQTVSRETATAANPNNLWGDMVQFAQYDIYGRQPTQYLPYTTTSQSGKFKTAPLTEQPQYYTTTYNESSAFSSITYDNSPLNRLKNVKQPGIAWAASAGTSAEYELNTTADNVQMFSLTYVQGSLPVHKGVYPANSLFKQVSVDENGKKVIQFIDKAGRTVLKKVQLDDNPAGVHSGWICTYSVYDDFGLLRYQVQPEGVKFMDVNTDWTFGGTNGTTLLNEQCFLYHYDDKGRITWKKAPGAQPLQMIYDKRDRVVFMQDGNQAALTTPQWTSNIYDDLDRSVAAALYNTTKSAATLQNDINNAAVTASQTITNPGTSTVTLSTSYNPLTTAELNNSSVTTVLKYIFYDNYSYNGVKTFNTSYTNLSAYSTADPNVIPIAWSKRTTSMPTGAMTRVLGATTFLATTVYYDEKGHTIQALQDNIKTGADITTLQYHFDGRLLSSCTDHTTPGTGYTNYKILTKNLFDKLGRVTSIQKQFGTNAFKTISTYEYDDAGRLKKKQLDPGYTAGGNAELESLNYSYNIHNQITGINKDYALKTPATYNKWGHFFGLYLGFDNRDNVFSAANLMGQVTGLLWSTQGDDAQRKYDYTYDNAGRLVNSAFKEKQHTGDAWSNSQMDFTVSGTSGKITYDLNGNLLNMLQKGVVPGTASPVTIDNLSYTYGTLSNKLQTVTDLMTSTTVNGKFGDFKDGTNGSLIADYVYDANGNVVIDLNKNAKDLAGVVGANGIKYNFLDKPEQIRIAGKGVIQIVYSADGQKLQRKFTSETENVVKTTTYINQFTYEESATTTGTVISPLGVVSINFEEGRIRVVDPVAQGNGLDALIVDGNMDLPNSKRGAYDYYIMDYQQNVRMILTEETHVASNTGTMETARAALEESIFGQTGSNNEVLVTRSPSPTTWQNGNIGAYVSKLGTNSGHNIGPNTLQRVMAGDKLTASVLYYHQAVSGGNNSNFVSTVLGSLGQALNGPGASANHLIGENAGAITTQLNGVPGFANAVQPGGSNPAGNAPQAFLTILFFDERFNFIPAADGGVAQLQVAASVGSGGSSLTLDNIKAPKNGYAYVYLSNQSNNDVFFDNLQVGKTAGNIIEENHYYSYGLKITAISSKKLGISYEGALKNNFLFQGGFNEFDDYLSWNNFALRNYDGQIGRFLQQDPYSQFPSSYTGMGNDPINLVDPSGGKTLPFFNATVSGLSTSAETAVTLGEVVVKSVGKVLTGASNSMTVANKVSIVIQTMSAAVNILNTNIETNQGGWIPVTNELFVALMRSSGVNASSTFLFNMKKGYLLEEAFKESYDFSDFRKRAFTPGPTYPDFVEPAYNVDADDPGLSYCIFYEVKAVKEIRLTTQIKNQISAAANMYVVRSGYSAGQLGIAEFNLVTFYENRNSAGIDDIKAFAKEKNVAFSVAYPLYNPFTRQIKFSYGTQITTPKAHQNGKGFRFWVPFERFSRWFFSDKVKLKTPNETGPDYYPDTNESGQDY